MKRLDAGVLVVLSGMFALGVGLSETALLYVRPGARLWLDLAGGILVILGLILVVLTLRHRARPTTPTPTRVSTATTSAGSAGCCSYPW